MKIRKAKNEDAVEMNNLKKETFERINSKDYPKEVVEEYKRQQFPSEIIRDMESGVYFVLEDKGNILGTVKLYNENIVGGVYVKYNHVGKGYGKMLMEFIEGYAREKNIEKLKLFPTATAEEFYAKLGYEKTGEIRTWNVVGMKYKISVMEKILK